MRRILTLTLLIFSVFVLNGQVLKPAEWQVSLSSDSPKVGEELTVIFDVKIDAKWYLYSNDFDPDLGPMLTEFEFIPHGSYELIGNPEPVNPKKKYDSLWEGEVSIFYEKAQFLQKIKILDPNISISGSYSYQVCTDIDGKCIPFDDEFELSAASLKKKK